MKKLFRLLSLITVIPVIAACSASQQAEVTNSDSSVTASRVINVKGSDTMAKLSQALADTFMAKYPEEKISVVGGGTATGIRALIDGTADLANASRPMTAEELTEAETNGIKPKEYPVALDGVAIVVSKSVKVKSLTIAQLSGILSGEVKNWNQVGGNASPITVVSRESNSGTYLYIKETVLKERSYSNSALMAQSSPGVADEVANRTNAIGYLGVADAHRNKTVTIIPISRDSRSPAVLPTLSNVKAGSYPLSRTLRVYVPTNPDGHVKQFVDFMESAEGQNVVAAQGYIPLK